MNIYHRKKLIHLMCSDSKSFEIFSAKFPPDSKIFKSELCRHQKVKRDTDISTTD